jgi:hypothetical protein
MDTNLDLYIEYFYSLGDCLGTIKEYGVSVDSSYQPQEKQLKRFINKINVEKYEGPVLPNGAANLLIESSRRFEAERYINICLIKLYETSKLIEASLEFFGWLVLRFWLKIGHGQFLLHFS